ncbi:MAG TPA: hypothetical protein VL360_01190 [Gammaproteobacteria bacterium]|nr:hypothetical protein [Gammaproteobacteria bacterium]
MNTKLHIRIITLLCAAIPLSACENIALMMTPAKKAQTSHTALAEKARNTFWDTLHKGNYNGLSETTKFLTAAYLENPNDPELAAFLGFSHIWRITERQRLTNAPSTIVDEMILSQKYFTDAVELNPSDPRYQGFLGDAITASGTIFHDQRQQVRGYFKLKHAISMWPEFNYFTAGYIMSSLDYNSEQFKEGLDWQWQTMDLCAETRVSRQNPDYSSFMHLETTHGRKRVCWNSWIAPHNFEGFFMNMGDMLVKQGDWRTAVKIYKNAKLSKTYSSWPYRDMLESRIKNAEHNVANFRNAALRGRDKVIMFNSGYGCAACHQK